MLGLLQELRKYKIFNLAGVDLIGSMVLFYMFGKATKTNPTLFAFASIPVSIAVHKLFNVETQLTTAWDELIEQPKAKPTTHPYDDVVEIKKYY